MSEVKVAIIPAAGFGTRFLPITKAIPKPMLPVLDKPTVQYITEELRNIGIEDVVIVISPDSKVIEKHFAKNEKLESRLISDGKQKLLEIEKQTTEFNVHFVVQKEANGLAGAILCAEEYVKDQPFALLLGDELLWPKNKKDSCIKRLKDIYEKTGKSVISAMTVFGDEVSKYGNIGYDKEENGVIEVKSIIEKPSINQALSNYAVVGRYVMASGTMERIKHLKQKGNEIMFSDVLDQYAMEGKLLASTFDDDRFDVGDKLGYVKANVEFALKSDEIGEDFKSYIKELAKKL